MNSKAPVMSAKSQQGKQHNHGAKRTETSGVSVVSRFPGGLELAGEGLLAA